MFSLFSFRPIRIVQIVSIRVIFGERVKNLVKKTKKLWSWLLTSQYTFKINFSVDALNTEEKLQISIVYYNSSVQNLLSDHLFIWDLVGLIHMKGIFQEWSGDKPTFSNKIYFVKEWSWEANRLCDGFM